MSTFNLKNEPSEEAPDFADPKDFDVLQGVSHISELKLEDELLDVYRRSKRLMASIESDLGIQPNHKVQAANAVNGILQDIVKTQERFYNVETLKAMEYALVETLKAFPDMKDMFTKVYADALKGIR